MTAQFLIDTVIDTIEAGYTNAASAQSDQHNKLVDTHKEILLRLWDQHQPQVNVLEAEQETLMGQIKPITNDEEAANNPELYRIGKIDEEIRAIVAQIKHQALEELATCSIGDRATVQQYITDIQEPEMQEGETVYHPS